MKHIYFTIIFCISVNLSIKSENYAKRQDWQWRSSVSLTNNKGVSYTVNPHLWIPPACEKITAVIIGSTAVIEQAMVEDPHIRAACAKNNIAIMWSADQFYHDDITASSQIQSMLDGFAVLTGYNELSTVPWIPTGHSGTNPMARYIVINNPQKVAFAIIHKAAAYCGNGSDIPILCTQGEYMEWDSYDRDLSATITKEGTYENVRNMRKNYTQPISYFFDPNTGHFDCSYPLLENIAMWIDDISALRFDSEGKLVPLDQTKGWITGLPCAGFLEDKFEPIRFTGIAVGTLPADRIKSAAWFPSERTAKAAYSMADVSMQRKAQVTGFADENGLYDSASFWWRAIMRNIPYTLLDDGHTVELNTVPYFRMPDRTDYLDNDNNPTKAFYNRTEGSFTNSGNPSQIEVVSGSWIKKGEKTFELIPRFRSANYFVVRQYGDDLYRSSVQVGNVNLANKTEGTDNVITFPDLQDIDIEYIYPIQLNASSSAGVDVRYFVNNGPARIENGKLIIELDSIPPRSRFPLPVTVTAYHLGTVSPAVKTANPVSRTFYIVDGEADNMTWYVSPAGNGDGTNWDKTTNLSDAVNRSFRGDRLFLMGRLSTGKYVFIRQ